MSLLRQLIKAPPVINDEALVQALAVLASAARSRGEPRGVFMSVIRREFRPLHKTGWTNRDLTTLEKRAEVIYASLPADVEAEHRWHEMYEFAQTQNAKAMQARREFILDGKLK
jgi:hypothetical protein